MAVFDPEDHDRLDRVLTGDGWITMYQELRSLETDLEWLSEQGYAIYRFECSDWSSDRDALSELARDIGFKDCYGREGGEACICDLDVPSDSGAAVVLVRYDHFARLDRVAAQAILDVLALNSRHFMLQGRRLFTLLQSDDPALAFTVTSQFGND